MPPLALPGGGGIHFSRGGGQCPPRGGGAVKYPGLKASRIVLEKGMPVIVRLGGFHTPKSFLGCVGYIMADSELEDLMRLVYPGDFTHSLT